MEEDLSFNNNNAIDNKINSDLKEIKDKLKNIKLSEEFKDNLKNKLKKELNDTK